MTSPIVGGLLSFLVGCAVSALNYRINLRVLKKKPSAIASISVLRQFLSVAYLVAVFLLSKVLPWDSVPLLLGAAIGLTIPAILLSMHLAKLNDALSSAEAADTSSEKGADSDG